MADYVVEAGTPTNITATALIHDGPAGLLGIWVSSASATPTIKVWNNTAASGGVIANTFIPVGGTFYPIPFYCSKGIFVTISGTVDCTVSHKP